MSELNELSNKKLIKGFAPMDSPVDYELELFKRLENNEFTDADVVEICKLLIEKREYEEIKYGD